MMTLGECPHDVLYLIFEEACASDAGTTARALSLTSRRISSIASTFLYHTVAVNGIAHARRTCLHLLSLSADRRAVRNLFIADAPTDYMDIVPVMVTPTSPVDRTSPGLQLRGKCGTEQAQAFQREADALLALLAPTLRTLACVTRNPWQYFVLANAHARGIRFPRLESLLLSQHSRMAFRPPISAAAIADAPPLFDMPRLRRLHLAYSGTGYIDFQVEGIVRLFAEGCPRLVQLRLSDVDFYFGGKDAMVRLLADMHASHRPIGTLHETPATAALTEKRRVPPSVEAVVVQLVRSLRAGIEEEDMRALRTIGLGFGGYFVLDSARLLRTLAEWREEWLEVARGGYDAWEHPERCHSPVDGQNRERVPSCIS